jgi:MFS family permease
MTDRSKWILPAIIFSQFAGTSLWFAGNAILPDLQRQGNLDNDFVGIITSAVQLGFIAGTLGFAVFTISDRFSPRIVFFVSCIAGAMFNICLLLIGVNVHSVLLLRFLTGVSLAGIYPVGMKIASGWYRQGLGGALGFLVGALVLGTSFPHFLKSFGSSLDWREVISCISLLSALGGLVMVLLVPDGPHLSNVAPFNIRAMGSIFKSKDLRSAAFGYFGHMWELYAFYSFLPFILSAYALAHRYEGLNVPLWSFAIIAAGCVGCAAGGMLSAAIGSAPVAAIQLRCSGACCLLSPLLFNAPSGIFLPFMIIWGISVVGDSPQYSALSARFAPQDLVGSTLTIMNSIGFSITIVSIGLTSYLSHLLNAEFVLLPLAIGPVIGLVCFRRLYGLTEFGVSGKR